MSQTAAFPAVGPIRLRARIRGCDLAVSAVPNVAETQVRLFPTGSGGQRLAERIRVTGSEAEVGIEVPSGGVSRLGMAGSVRIEVSLPAGSSLDILGGSGDISGTGELGEVLIKAGSGEVGLQEAASVQATIGSGDLTVQRAGGGTITSGSGSVRVGASTAPLQVVSGSGDVSIDDARDAELTAGSGSLTVGECAGAVGARVASGRIRVERVGPGTLSAVAASGDISVAVAPGVAALLDVSSITGRVRSDLEPSHAPAPDEPATELHLRTASGDIRISRA